MRAGLSLRPQPCYDDTSASRPPNHAFLMLRVKGGAMAYVLWCEMFSIVVPYIDDQHKKLVRIVNEFHAALKEKRAGDAVFTTLNRLIEYTERHFRDEEKLMQLAEYPAEHLHEHKKIHARLFEEIFELQEQYFDHNDLFRTTPYGYKHRHTRR